MEHVFRYLCLVMFSGRFKKKTDLLILQIHFLHPRIDERRLDSPLLRQPGQDGRRVTGEAGQ